MATTNKALRKLTKDQLIFRLRSAERDRDIFKKNALESIDLEGKVDSLESMLSDTQKSLRTGQSQYAELYQIHQRQMEREKERLALLKSEAHLKRLLSTLRDHRERERQMLLDQTREYHANVSALRDILAETDENWSFWNARHWFRAVRKIRDFVMGIRVQAPITQSTKDLIEKHREAIDA